MDYDLECTYNYFDNDNQNQLKGVYNVSLPNNQRFSTFFKSGRFLITVLLLCSMLAGCGTSQNSGSSASPESNGAEPSTAEQGSENTRTISTIKGDIEIPAEPKKIAGMLYVFADQLLALGIEPTAMVTYNDLGFPEYLADQMKDTTAIGSGESPNFEALLQAEPDLILASKTLNEANYEQLSKIAPTILFDNEEKGDWERFMETATVLGKEKEAQAVKDAYDAKVTTTHDELAVKAKNETVAYMRVQDKQLQLIKPDDNFTLFGALGLTPASVDSVDFQGSWNVAVSEEILPELNPDRLFIILRPGEENKVVLNNIMDTSIWSNLNAVKNDHVYIGDANLWFAGYGPIGLSKIIDEIAASFEL